MDRTKTIAALAANPHSAIKDLKILEKMDDATLQALEAGAEAAAAAIKTAQDAASSSVQAAKEAQAQAEVALKAAQDQLAAPVAEDRLPPEYRAMMAERRDADTKEQTELVTKLKAAQSAFSEDELKAMALPQLRKLALISVKETAPSFGGRAVPRMASEQKTYAAPDPWKPTLTALQSGK